ncbi:MAG: helix-turn-helix domain-containing protein [Spirochaetaceae bacterium]
MEPKDHGYIGRNLKKLREKHGITLSVLSEKCGVAKNMLTEIESGQVNPTIAMVWKIAQGLDVDINALLTGQDTLQRTFHVNRKDEITRLEADEEGVHIHVLSPLSMAEDLEMYILTFQKGQALHSDPHAIRTEEFLTILEGAVRVTADNNSTDLYEGDFIRYHADTEHVIENIHDGKTRIYMVVRFQKRQYE